MDAWANLLCSELADGRIAINGWQWDRSTRTGYSPADEEHAITLHTLIESRGLID